MTALTALALGGAVVELVAPGGEKAGGARRVHLAPRWEGNGVPRHMRCTGWLATAGALAGAPGGQVAAGGDGQQPPAQLLEAEIPEEFRPAADFLAARVRPSVEEAFKTEAGVWYPGCLY